MVLQDRFSRILRTERNRKKEMAGNNRLVLKSSQYLIVCFLQTFFICGKMLFIETFKHKRWNINIIARLHFNPILTSLFYRTVMFYIYNWIIYIFKWSCSPDLQLFHRLLFQFLNLFHVFKPPKMKQSEEGWVFFYFQS